ncbi:MAG: prepilin-type N-terminal cleavage/methylation domain-containing protein [Cyanobacteria bacterium J06639_1]
MLFRLLRQRIFSRASTRNRGFTLTELLVGLVTSSIFLAATGGIVIEVIKQERREEAKTLTQLEMQLAMDYIRRDLQESVFVYSGQELQDRLVAPGYINTNDTPVLAFWKLREAKECKNDFTTTTCNGDPGNQGIGALSLVGNMYVLVVYYWQANSSSTVWPEGQFGPARITRLELDALADGTLAQRGDYRAPSPPRYLEWPYVPPSPALAGFDGTQSPREVLTAFVDGNSSATATITCPANYNPSPDNTGTPAAPNAFYAFYACVRDQNAPTDAQDVIVHIRGNALARADGTANSNDRGFFPELQTTVFARTQFSP